jgi:hypothetical protein
MEVPAKRKWQRKRMQSKVKGGETGIGKEK